MHVTRRAARGTDKIKPYRNQSPGAFHFPAQTTIFSALTKERICENHRKILFLYLIAPRLQWLAANCAGAIDRSNENDGISSELGAGQRLKNTSLPHTVGRSIPCALDITHVTSFRVVNARYVTHGLDIQGV